MSHSEGPVPHPDPTPTSPNPKPVSPTETLCLLGAPASRSRPPCAAAPCHHPSASCHTSTCRHANIHACMQAVRHTLARQHLTVAENRVDPSPVLYTAEWPAHLMSSWLPCHCMDPALSWRAAWTPRLLCREVRENYSTTFCLPYVACSDAVQLPALLQLHVCLQCLCCCCGVALGGAIQVVYAHSGNNLTLLRRR